MAMAAKNDAPEPMQEDPGSSDVGPLLTTPEAEIPKCWTPPPVLVEFQENFVKGYHWQVAMAASKKYGATWCDIKDKKIIAKIWEAIAEKKNGSEYVWPQKKTDTDGSQIEDSSRPLKKMKKEHTQK